MRDAYHEELAWILGRLVDMTDEIKTALHRATAALLSADNAAAAGVINGDAKVDDARSRVERRTLDLIARQQPVAGDLRVLMAGLRIATDLERAGDHAVHLARLTRRRFPAHAIPDSLHGLVRQMAEVAERIVDDAGTAIAASDSRQAMRLDAADDAIDDMVRHLFTVIVSTVWTYGVEAALDVAAAARHYERFADHAVSVARQVAFLVTGEVPIQQRSLATRGATE